MTGASQQKSNRIKKAGNIIFKNKVEIALQVISNQNPVTSP